MEQLIKYGMKIVLLIVSSFYFNHAFTQVYPIGNTAVTWTDTDRGNRQVDLKIYYPAQAAGNNAVAAIGSFPSIVFAHGFSMSYTSYQHLWEYYVPKGYVMVMVDMEGGFSPDHENFGRDILFAGKTFEEKCSQDNTFLFYQKHNGKTAFAGHSMGGGSAVLAASYEPTFPDAVIGLAPAETTPSAITAAANVVAPYIVFSGTGDAVTPPAQHHIPIYHALGSDCKRLVNIQGGIHCYFANTDVACDFGESFSGSTATISRTQQQTITNSMALPFFELYLKGNTQQQDSLNTALSQPGITVINDCISNAEIASAYIPEIKIFPNPSVGEIIVSHIPEGIKDIYVTDVAGKCMVYTLISGDTKILDLPVGFYIIRVGHYSSKVFVVQ